MKWLIAYLLLLLTDPVWAQDIHEEDFSFYTTADGLSHNNITDIAQDSTGYIWASTMWGLNRYNGSNFVQFHSTDNDGSLASEIIIGMRWIDRQRLAAICNFTGLHIVNTRTAATNNLFIPYPEKLYQYKFNSVENIMGDKNHHIYVVTRSGFYHFDQHQQLVFRFDALIKEKVATETSRFARDIMQLDDNRYMILTPTIAYIYHKQTHEFREMKPADCPSLTHYLQGRLGNYSFFQQKPGIFLVLTSGTDSVSYINLQQRSIKHYRWPFRDTREEFFYRSKLFSINDSVLLMTSHLAGFYRIHINKQTQDIQFEPRKYFPTVFCSGLLMDREQHLWVATNQGLYRQNDALAKVQIAPIPTNIIQEFPNSPPEDIYVSNDQVFTGMRRFGGLLVFNKASFQFEKRVTFDHYPGGKSVNHIYALEADTHGLLLGTGSDLLQMNMQRYSSSRLLPAKDWDPYHEWIQELYKDKSGNIWIAANDLYRYQPVTGEFTKFPVSQPPLNKIQRPVSIREDAEGNIWVAGHGLCRYNTRKQQFDLLLESFPYVKMPDRQINSMTTDAKNNIWFNSNNNGLTCYNISTGKYRHFSRKDGLPDNDIASLLVIGERLWIAAYTGIACMDLRTMQINSFGKEDGFPDMPIANGTRFFYDEKNDLLYVGFMSSLVRFKPYDLIRKRSSPSVFIERITTGQGNQYFLPGPVINSSWKDNELTITIGTINFTNSASQRFAYRILKTPVSPWQSLGNQSSFNISNLPPGKHVVQVRVSSLSNNWPEQVKEISIVIAPPFWKKTWFLVVITVLLILLIHLLIRWRTSVARKKEMEKTNIEKIKADNYKSQFELEQISNYFSSSLAGKKTPEDVLWDVARNLIGRMNYVDCMIYLWNEDKTKMVQKASYGIKNTPAIISQQQFDVLPSQGVVGYVMKTRQPLLIPDTRKDPRYRVDELFRLSEICVPIMHNGELIGIIDSEHHELDYFNERDIKILTTIATLIANKLTQLQSEQTLEVKKAELATINQQLAEAQLSALQAQMNPHFVFNALNSIKRMILDSDNKKASRYLSKFALMIRMTLDHSKNIFASLDESITYINAYLEMEQLRFDDSFTYTIIADDAIDMTDTAIPSMMIQPLVENAIWHGLMQVNEEKKILIRFSQEESRITCMIEDNGIGIRQSEKLKKAHRPLHHSVGLENLHNRIKIMNEKYDMNCSLEITDLGEQIPPGRGTRVTLRFNILNL